jgi:hypothetical protein
MWDYVRDNGIKVTQDAGKTYGLTFTEDATPANGETANKIDIKFTLNSGGTKTSTMEYDAEKGAYRYYQYDQLMTDGNTGELELYEIEDKIILRRFMEEPIVWKISELVDELGGQGAGGHGGSDWRMFDSLYNIYFTDKLNASSAIEGSVESHYIALAAEDSRLAGGKLMEIADYRK